MDFSFGTDKIDLSLNLECGLVDETITLSLYRRDRAVGAILIDNQLDDAVIAGLEFDLPRIGHGIRAFWSAI